jgi:hypothetical protein
LNAVRERISSTNPKNSIQLKAAAVLFDNSVFVFSIIKVLASLAKMQYFCRSLNASLKERRYMKYTQTTLDKIGKIVEETGYIVRYERGSFQSGYCILEDKKVVVLNKFLQLEGRINTLIDLIPALKIDAETLSPESRKVFDDIMSRQGPVDKLTG